MKEKSLWGRISLAMIVSVGFAVASGTVLGVVVFQVIRGYFPPDNTTTLSFTKDGMPVVIRTASGIDVKHYQDLDGNTLPAEQFENEKTESDWLVEGYDFVSLPAGLLEPKLEMRAPWDQRIFYFDDGHRPRVLWYLVTDGLKPSTAYFVGYHAKSNERVGFIGRRGFQKDFPSAEVCFQLLCPKGTLHDSVVTTGSYNSRVDTAVSPAAALEDRRIPNWLVYVPDVNGTWYSVNLRDRTVASVPHAGSSESGTIFTRSTKTTNPGASGVNWFALRTDADILLLDSGHEVVKRFRIPEALWGKDFRWAMTRRGESLFDTKKRLGFSSNYHHDMNWCTAEGAILHSAQATIVQDESRPFDQVAGCLILVLLSIPALWNYHWFCNEPMNFLDDKLASSFSEALRLSLQDHYVQLLICHAAALFFAYLCYRRQVRFAATKKERIAWTLFVFIMGFPGWIGYRFGRKWPVMEACESCGRTVPLDRESCAACASDFPLPALTGTEVFA